MHIYHNELYITNEKRFYSNFLKIIMVKLINVLYLIMINKLLFILKNNRFITFISIYAYILIKHNFVLISQRFFSNEIHLVQAKMRS